jgi:hypothetical protein
LGFVIVIWAAMDDYTVFENPHKTNRILSIK